MFLTHDNHIKWEKMGVGALVTGVLVFLGIEWFDKPLFLFLRQFDCSFWHHLDAFFAPKVWIFLTCIAAMVYCIVNYDSLGIKKGGNLSSFFEKTKRNNAFLIFYSVLGAGVTVKVLKTLIGRARPVFFEALGMTGFYPPSMEWAFNSMPSGHATVSFAGLVMVGMLAPKYKALTWTLAIVIAVSRVMVGAHWPSDVIFGAFVGMAVADIVKGTLLRK